MLIKIIFLGEALLSQAHLALGLPPHQNGVEKGDRFLCRVQGVQGVSDHEDVIRPVAAHRTNSVS